MTLNEAIFCYNTLVLINKNVFLSTAEKSKIFITKQNVLDTNAGKQLS
jgi:hypothetical protein